MPAPIEIVEPPVVVRDLHDDERNVVDFFDRHVSHCTQCGLALETAKDTLCERGQRYAVDVTTYLYSVDGKHFSVVDRENNKPMRVKLLHQGSHARTLIENIDKGMRLASPRRGRAPPVQPPSTPPHRSTSVRTSYDATYPVGPRRSGPMVQQREPRSRSHTESPQPSPNTRIIERSPSNSKPRIVIYPSPHGSPNRSSNSRGSLYNSDRQDRVERIFESTNARRRSDYYR
ncbi:uncharacterized protein N7482_004154 [Penicillium canariense]|uniref:Uncharacterized protein n=1 Tax=Penicillium canariense TaxID=189055 RepID=A0A9W9I8L0_9EURO|nr:uncharacterized protein N7482_004154 [Penicillium canariense]KAJ5168560.1 hypothetical protein N7482_004154 [Penicillium canariense]